MENFFARFPHLSKQIFRSMDNKCLANAREVSRSWNKETLRSIGKKCLIQKMKKTLKNFHNETYLNLQKFKLTKSWENLFDKGNTETIIEFSQAFVKFYTEVRRVYNVYPRKYPGKYPDTYLCIGGLQPLHIAAATGHVTLYETLLENSRIKNPSDKNGNKPLHHAVFYGHLEMCQSIISRKFKKDKNPKSNNDYSALYSVASNGHIDMCKFILENIKDKSIQNKIGDYGEHIGFTPLHSAARHGHSEVYKLIMDTVEDKNPQDKEGKTPLHEAATFGHSNVCKMIISQLEEGNPKTDYANTPLNLAAEHGHFEVFKLIINKTKDKNPISKYGKSALHDAALGGHLEICRLIIENTKDKNPADIKMSNECFSVRETPLHMAAYRGHIRGRYEVFKLIFENAEDKNPRGSDGQTPLHIAAENGCLDICELIVKNPGVKDKNPRLENRWVRNLKGETPLHLAAKGGHLEVCQLILTYAEDKNPERRDGMTPGELSHKECCMNGTPYTYYHGSVCKLFSELVPGATDKLHPKREDDPNHITNRKRPSKRRKH